MPQFAIGDPDPPETPGSGKTYIPYYPYPFVPFPYIPFVPDPYPWTPVPRENRCPRCGIKWEGVMGYVCGDPNCPMQPRITW